MEICPRDWTPQKEPNSSLSSVAEREITALSHSTQTIANLGADSNKGYWEPCHAKLPPPLLPSPRSSTHHLNKVLLCNTRWPPCAWCQLRKQRKKAQLFHLLASQLRLPLLAIHGLHSGRTFSPKPVPALHWQCTSPFHRHQWRSRLSSPLLSHIHLVNTTCRSPRTQGTQEVPAILNTSPDPYHPLPHSTVPKHLVRASLVSLSSTTILSTPFPHLLPHDLRSPYLKASALLSTDPEAWQAAAAFRLYARMPHEQYGLLLLRLFHLNMVSFLPRSDIQVVNGVQAVWKKKNKQRLIFDGRPVNRVLLPPPSISLPHPTDLCSLLLNKDESFILTKLDLDSYYHRLSVPSWLLPYLGLPTLFLLRLSAHTRHLVARTFSAFLPSNNSHLSPVATTLPMDLSHSVFIAQSIHLSLLSRIHPSLHLPTPNQPMSPLDNQLSLVYIDVHCLLWRTSPDTHRRDTQLATDTLHALISAYTKAGFPVMHSKTIFPTSSLTFLGIHLDGNKGLLLPDWATLTDLLTATSWAQNSPSVSHKHLQCLVGHWVWLLLLCRPLFALLYAIYCFLTACSPSPPLPPLWASVRNELAALPHLASLLFADLRRPPTSIILASDASLSGAGAVQATLSSLPPSPISGYHWRYLFSLKWRVQEPIILLEGRALLYAIRRLAFAYKGVNRRLHLFSDNQPLVYATIKGRSSTYGLSRILRSLAASLLASSSSL